MLGCPPQNHKICSISTITIGTSGDSKWVSLSEEQQNLPRVVTVRGHSNFFRDATIQTAKNVTNSKCPRTFRKLSQTRCQDCSAQPHQYNRDMKWLCALSLLWMLLGSGCASKKGAIDWQARVGVFTYDQAVSELGPPDRESKLSEGTRVAEWHLRERGGVNLSFGLGSYSRHSGVGVGQQIGSWRGGNEYHRLVFRPDGVLKSSERVLH